MKTKTGFILGFIVILIGGIMMVVPLARHDFNIIKMEQTALIKTTSYHNNINTIDLFLRGESVEIIRNDLLVNEIRVTRFEDDNDNRFIIADNNQTLNIRRNRRSWLRELRIINNPRNEAMVIEIPYNMVNELIIEGRSGFVEITGFTFDKLDVQMRSGRIELLNVEVNLDLNLRATSGRIILDNVSAKEAQITISTGRINLKETEFETATLIATSGRINVSNSTITNLDSSIRSGNMTFNDFTTKVARASASSGRITMRIRGNQNEFNVEVRTGSGRSNIGNQTVLGSDYSLNLRITSGRIDVTFI